MVARCGVCNVPELALLPVYVPGWDDASGHADCWEDTKCLWRDYGKKAKEIYFWEAP